MKKTKKMQKTIIALVLAIIMALSGSTAAFANEEITVTALTVDNTSIAAVGVGIAANRSYYLNSINPYVTFTTDEKEYTTYADEFERETGLTITYTAVGAEETWVAGGKYEVKAKVQECEATFDVTIDDPQIDRIECEDLTVQKSESYNLVPKFTVYMKDETQIESIDGTIYLNDYGYSEKFTIKSYSKQTTEWVEGDEVTVTGNVLGVDFDFKVTVADAKYTRLDISGVDTLTLVLTDSTKKKTEFVIDSISVNAGYAPKDYLKADSVIICTMKSEKRTFENVEITYESTGNFSNLFKEASISWNGVSSDTFENIWLKSQLLQKSNIASYIANQVYLGSGIDGKYGFSGKITKDNIEPIMSVALEWCGLITSYGADEVYSADTVESAIKKVFGLDIKLADYTTVESGNVVLKEYSPSLNGGTVSFKDGVLTYEHYLLPTFNITIGSDGCISSFGFDTISAEHKHTLEKIPAKSATETEDGNIEYWRCTDVDCAKIFADKYGTTEIELKDTIIHDMEHHAAVAPTCTKEGNDEYWYCKSCKKYFSDAAGTTEIEKDSWIIDATGHSFTSYTSNGDATCTKDGTKTATCDNLGCTEKETVTDVGSKLGHSFKTYVSNHDATCTKDGTKTAQCTRTDCDATDTITDEGTALGHTMDYHAATEATYIKKGNTEYWYCTVCKKYFSDVDGKTEIKKDSWVIDEKEWNGTLAYDPEKGVESFGSKVREVQQYLIDHKYLEGTPSGDYDDETAAAVTAFQAQTGLVNPDGKVGSWTITRMRSVTADFKTLVKGNSGNPVKIMQTYLVKLGYLNVEPDGIYGDMSVAAIKKFQLLNSLPITGDADIVTLRKLYSSNPIKFRVLSTNMNGDDVKVIQEQLVSLGYLAATPDGIYGNYTKAAVTAFQAANGLYEVDGMVGNWTMSVLASGVAKSFYEFSKGEIGASAYVMQKYLADYGYLNVEPDGIFGDMSEAAIKKFQLLNDLGITGKADKDTLYKLYHTTAMRLRTLTTGMKGDDVKIVQQKLADLGYFEETVDGTYDNYTKAAVTAFQAANGLENVDGMCGSWTTEILASSSPVEFSELKKGDSGTAVKVMQQYLVNLGYLEVEPDGIFGDMSKTALMEFQLLNGIDMTGVADQKTLYKLYQSSAVTKRTLTLQNYGSDVLIVQKALVKLGYTNLSTDSTYGTQTRNIVAQFQRSQGLASDEVDGMVGNWTLGEIVKELEKQGFKTV